MRLLIQGPRLDNYLAKCHEALRTGLTAIFDTRFFGKGYSGYGIGRFLCRDFPSIVRRLFPDKEPDWIFTQNIQKTPWEFVPRYSGLEKVQARKAILLADYWLLAEKNPQELPGFVEAYGIDLVFSYFPQPLEIWSGTVVGPKLKYLPPTFDPQLFNDWGMPKIYDVGFLAAGTVNPVSCYPERQAIHQVLMAQKDLRYLWAPHPGWKRHGKNAPLVGKHFSRAINSCKMFVTTGGIWGNANPKYFEILASRSLLLAEEPVGAEKLGLVDGVNYVKISQEDILDKIHFYLKNEHLAVEIANRGFALAMTRHNCYARAAEFHEVCLNKTVSDLSGERAAELMREQIL